jgi:methyl-accepting chemotaxis protein
MPNTNLEFLFIIFIGITGFAVLLQAGILLAMYLVVRKAVKAATDHADEFKSKLAPVLESSHKFLTTGHDLIDSTRAIVQKLDPRVEATVKEIEKMVQQLHGQATRLQQSIDDVAQKTRRHVDRVDGMTTSFLDGVDRAGKFVNHAIDVPVRHAAGVVAAAKAVVDVLRTPRARHDPRRTPAAAQPVYETDGKDVTAERPHRAPL